MKKKLVLTGLSGVLLGSRHHEFGVPRPHTSKRPSRSAGSRCSRTDAAKGKGKQAVSTVPCGPNIQGDLGKNTARDSRCFEIRFYTVDPHSRWCRSVQGRHHGTAQAFREGELEVFKKNGVDVMAVWQNLGRSQHAGLSAVLQGPRRPRSGLGRVQCRSQVD